MASIQRREAKNGDVTYRVQVRLKGFPTERATFKRLTDARRWAQSIESAMREGRHFKSRESKRHTFGEMIDRYVDTVLPGRLRDGARRQRQLDWWKSQLGEYSLADVTAALIAEQRDRLAQRRKTGGQPISDATVNRYLAALSHVMKLAANEWGWLEVSPMRKVSRRREPRGRLRFLSEAEIQRLLTACESSTNSCLRPMVVLALSTGMRRGELLGLSWPAVDLARGRIILERTKNGSARAVPLTDHAVAVLRAHGQVRMMETDLVFPSPRTRTAAFPAKAWSRALKAAEIENFRFHDLRHTAASYLAMSGASAVQIAEILGHKTLQMVKRYAHLSDQGRRAVVQPLDALFGTRTEAK